MFCCIYTYSAACMSRIRLHLCVVKILSVLLKWLVRRQKSASFIKHSWHVMAEAVTSFLTLSRSTPVFLPKMFQPGAYYTFLLKASVKLSMRYVWGGTVCSVSNFLGKMFIKRWYGKVCFFEALCQTLPFMGRKAVPRSDYCIRQIFALKPHQCAPMLRSGITQIWDIQRHPPSTHMTRSHLLTGRQSTFCQMRQHVAGLPREAGEFLALCSVKLYENVF